MDIFLRFSHVHIETDCKSILFLKAAKNSADVLTRYAIQLASYNITMEHIPGKENIISDALSRSRDIQEDEPKVPYMNEKEANILIKALKMPTSTKFSMKDMKELLQINVMKMYNVPKIELNYLSETGENVSLFEITYLNGIEDRMARGVAKKIYTSGRFLKSIVFLT